MSASKEYKAVRNCILNELHLTKEDIIKNIEPLLEKLVKQCMNNTYGNNNQIEHWIRCMVNDELKQRDYDFVRRICKEVIKDHVLNELNIIVSSKNERSVCENRVPSRKDGLYLIYGNGHAEPFTGENIKKNVRYIGLKHKDVSFAISLTEHDRVQLLDDDYGVLVFKWNEDQVTVKEVLRAIDRQPLFGHTTGRSGKTMWMCFMKLPNN